VGASLNTPKTWIGFIPCASRRKFGYPLLLPPSTLFAFPSALGKAAKGVVDISVFVASASLLALYFLAAF
jgi:hypothetical protein